MGQDGIFFGRIKKKAGNAVVDSVIWIWSHLRTRASVS
jgi:hypothetical protein